MSLLRLCWSVKRSLPGAISATGEMTRNRLKLQYSVPSDGKKDCSKNTRCARYVAIQTAVIGAINADTDDIWGRF